MMIYNTDTARVEYYLPDTWASIQAPFATAHSCTAAIDCASEYCIDGYCCDTTCSGNCDRCNVAGSIGTCTDVESDCTGNCDICSSGNCAASVGLCTGNCDVCTGSGTAYSCAASDSLCTGNCDVCSGSGTAYSCAASDALCSTCYYCAGFGTIYNCDTVAKGTSGYGCTAAHYRCDGSGACTAPFDLTIPYVNWNYSYPTCTSNCASLGYICVCQIACIVQNDIWYWNQTPVCSSGIPSAVCPGQVPKCWCKAYVYP